jgi:hypothetical protein
MLFRKSSAAAAAAQEIRRVIEISINLTVCQNTTNWCLKSILAGGFPDKGDLL